MSVKLKLENIRSWASLDLSFPESGLVLIKGQSGSGKSSLFQAVYFALTGLGTRILRYGCKKAKAELTLSNGLCITRSKGPGLLNVQNAATNDVLYDDQAQSAVDKLFPNIQFQTYMVQKNPITFINCSQSDRLDYLQSVSLQGFDVTSVKQKVKADVNSLSTAIQGIHQNLQTQQQICKEQALELENFAVQHSYLGKFDRSEQTLDELRESLQHPSILMATFDQLTQECFSYQKAIQEKLSCQAATATKFEELSRLKEELESDKHCFSIQLNSLNKRTRDATFSGFEDVIRYKTLQSEISILTGQIDELNSSMEQLESTVARVQMEMTEVESRFNKCSTALRLYESTAKHKQKLTDLEAELTVLEDLKVLLEEMKHLPTVQQAKLHVKQAKMCTMRTLKCPSCQEELALTSSLDLVTNSSQNIPKSSDSSMSLEKCQDTLADIEHKTKRLTNYSHLLQTFKVDTNLDIPQMTKCVKGFIDQLVTQVSDCKAATKIIESLNEQQTCCRNRQAQLATEHSCNSKQIAMLRPQVQKSKLERAQKTFQLEHLSEKVDILKISSKNLSDLVCLHEQHTQTQSQAYRVQTDIACIDKRLTDVSTQLMSFDYSPEELKDALSKLESDLSIVENKKASVKTEISRSSDVRHFLDLSQDLLNCTREKEKLQNDLSDIECQYQNLLCFQQKVSEAESQALEQTTMTLENLVNGILQSLFSENPLTCSLELFKELKNHLKPHLTIKLFYKNQETDLTALSGGEYDRVQLAFQLACQQMQGGRILMIDEALSSLDMETSQQVLSEVKHFNSNTLVLVIAHNVDDSSFDKVIDVDALLQQKN